MYEDHIARQYRKQDEAAIKTEDFLREKEILQTLCASLPRESVALDIGCGTGRYFHCLRGVSRLVGMDLSLSMLQLARQPVQAEQIASMKIDLLCADIHRIDFPENTFNLIYSFGTLGERTHFDSHLCAKFQAWLRPGGKIFFTVADIEYAGHRKTLKRRIAEALSVFLPREYKERLQQRWNRWLPLYLSWEQLENILKGSPFEDYSIERRISQQPDWRGAHLECTAKKE